MRHLSLLLLLPLAACPGGGFSSDSGQLTIDDDAVVDIGSKRFLAGSQLCPTVAVVESELPDGEYEALDCFAQSFEGPVGDDGTCLHFTDPGTVDWTFTPRECPGNEFGYTPAPDHVALDIVAAGDVSGRLPMSLEESIEAAAADNPLVRLEGAEGWMRADGEPLRLVADMPFRVDPHLLTDAGTVAWREGELTAGAGVTVRQDDTKGVWTLVASEGANAKLTLGVDGGSFEVGTVVGVPASAVTSVEVAVLSMDMEEAGTSMPFAARAVLRDKDGNLVFGGPVEWRHAALLVSSGPGNGLPGQDYVMFHDACSDPGSTVGEQRATLRASIGLVSDVVELVWTPRLEADPEEGWTPHEDCQPPLVCGCASGGAAPVGLVAVVLAALGLRRRR